MIRMILLGLAALPFLGCSDPPNHWETRGDRILGIGTQRVEDPVSGALVDKEDAIKREYKGTTYYFESTENASTFMSNPTEYAIPESEVRDVR